MYTASLKTRKYHFKSINEVLGKANEEKSGDRSIGLSAQDESERVAARRCLSEFPLKLLYENPAIPYEQCEVTRFIMDHLESPILKTILNLSVGELREFFLEKSGAEIASIRGGLSPEMVASAVKLCSNMDLISIAKKCRNPSSAKVTLGCEGTLSSRLQPNHPTDSVMGILALAYEGLSYGSGDAMIGINPAIDSVENVARLAEVTQELIQRYQIPTVCCILAHVTTQMEAVKRKAPLDILFQSIAGSERANQQFGITIDLLKQAAMMASELHGGKWKNTLYFETGQGSELSLDSHEGVDQLTLEARTYGIAQHFSPYMVNNVSGFIGPETLFDGKQMIRANLEDLCMGKVMGLPMGMAPCYTTHAEIDQNDHEIATMLLSLGGANYFMGIAQNEDVMLSYQDTSFHDDATLRELLGLTTTPEFAAWMERMGLTSEGIRTSKWGDPSVFK